MSHWNVYFCFLISSLSFVLISCEEGNVVELRAFGEGRCKDTTHWFKWHLMPMWKLIQNSGRIKLDYHPFGVKTSCEYSGKDIVCDCHHGERECLLNQLQSCVIDELPNFEDHIDYVSCIQGKENITDAGNNCFYENSRLEKTKMLNCADSRKGRELFWKHEEYKLTYAPDNDWVPWILINGERYKEAEEDLWQFLCDRFLKPRPIECPRRIFY